MIPFGSSMRARRLSRIKAVRVNAPCFGRQVRDVRIVGVEEVCTPQIERIRFVSNATPAYDGAAIVTQCREAARARLVAQMQPLMASLSERLQKEAQSSRDREERDQYADAASRLRDKHAAFAEAFEKELVARVDASTQALQSGRLRGGDEEDLSMLKTNLLENQVAVNKLAVLLKQAAGADLSEFSARIASAFGRRVLDDGDNPVGPMAIAYAVYSGIEALDLKSQAARALRPDLEKRLVTPVCELYRVMNGALERAGISPAAPRGEGASHEAAVSGAGAAADGQHGAEASAKAQAAAAQTVAAMLGVAAVPAPVAMFLQETWTQVLARAHAQGTDSAAWRDAVDVMNELIASVKPGIDTAERARLKGVLPGLLKSLQAGMDAVALDAGKRKAVLDMLMDHHREILLGGARPAHT